MASFDIFCEPHMGCIKTAVAEANALAAKRYDWRDTNASYTLTKNHIVLDGVSYQQLNQMLEELCFALRKELVSLAFIEVGVPKVYGDRQSVRLKIERGITREWAEYLIKVMQKFCIPAKYSYQNEEIHVVTAHIDDAQYILAQLRFRRVNLPIHFRNLSED